MTYKSKKTKFERALTQVTNIDQKDSSEAQLKEKAERLVKDRELMADINITAMFTDSDEQSLSKDLLKKYLQDYTIETISDKNTLRQVIYLEITHVRFQNALNELKDLKVVPDKLVKTMHDNLNQIISLKDKLGITRTKKDEAVKDGFGYLQMLKRKYKVWLKDNQATRHMFCPHCVKPIMMVIKPDSWIALKHPFFKDRILGNEALIKVYKEQRPLTVQDVRDIFGTSDDYITGFLLTKGWGLKLEESKTTPEAKAETP